MPRYESFDSQAEMTGRTVLSFVKSIMHEDITGILARHHLDNIEPDGWYPVQMLLDVLSEISEGTNTSSIFVSIGVAAAQIGLDAMPPAMKAISLEEFFSKYDAIWKSRHRNGDGGSVRCEQVDENHLILHVKTPYPDDVFYGAMYAYARFFCPRDKTFSIAYDETLTPRDAGGDETVMHIRLQR